MCGKFDEEKQEGGMGRFRKGEGRDPLDEGRESERSQEQREVDRRVRERLRGQTNSVGEAGIHLNGRVGKWEVGIHLNGSVGKWEAVTVWGGF